jgi:hypothetical protein
VTQTPVAIEAVEAIELRVLNMRTRMPFRYGIATLTALPHLFLRVRARIGGKVQEGLASEGLPPKWFTKNPTTTFKHDLDEMLRVIQHACSLALGEAGDTASDAASGTARRTGPRDGAIDEVGGTGGTGASNGQTFFEWWHALHTRQQHWGALQGYPPLLSGLGASLVERATIDAFCRATGHSFANAVRANSFGIDLGTLHPELAGKQPADLLPAAPLERIIARHTVGLADPLTDAEILPEDRADDGLPQSLEACIRAYGLTHFKLKLFGDLPRDVARLRQIAVVLQQTAAADYAFTLDGNEQYVNVPTFRTAWDSFLHEPSLRGLMRHLLFVEQPLHRDVSLSEAAARDFAQWSERPPIIIDESDGDVESLPTALAAGYAGTSHKNCKGVMHGIASACLIAHRQALNPRTRYVLSGEDLANVGPVAMLQDLAAMATFGVTHVERNGHHYFRGLSMLPKDAQAQVLAHHGDLYRRAPEGYPALDVRDGQVNINSIVAAPFGPAFLLETSQFTPLDTWEFASLGVQE